MLYSNNPDHHLHLVYTTSATGRPKDKDLNILGYPVDIIETDYGIAFFGNSVDENYGFLIGLNKNTFSLKFNRTIVNNGDHPNNITDQINFYGSGKKPLFGMAMWE